MSDRDEIAELVHRYCDAVTRLDPAAWASTWADDAWWDLGKGRLTTGKAAIVAYWHDAIAQMEMVVQMAHNGSVTIDGDTASGRWYISEHVQRKSGELGILLAWYDDTYARHEGAWRFTSRKLTALYHGPPDLSAGFTHPTPTPPDTTGPANTDPVQ